jgi:hypothetical protein
MGSWILIAVLSLSLVLLYKDNKDTRECLSTYIQNDSAATKTRAQYAEAERAQFTLVMSTLVAGDEEGFKDAATAYAALLVKNDKLRVENPYPPFPEGC